MRMFLKKILRVDAEFEFLPNADATIEGVRIKEGFFSGNSFKKPYFHAQCDPHSDKNVGDQMSAHMKQCIEWMESVA